LSPNRIYTSHLVDFVNNSSSAWIHQHHSIAGIDVAIFGDGGSPILRRCFKLNAGGDLSAEDNSFLDTAARSVWPHFQRRSSSSQ
jgi:hypothetical protein